MLCGCKFSFNFPKLLPCDRDNPSAGSKTKNPAEAKRRKVSHITPLQCHPWTLLQAPLVGLEGVPAVTQDCQEAHVQPRTEVLCGVHMKRPQHRQCCDRHTQTAGSGSGPNWRLRARGPGRHTAMTRHCILSLELFSLLIKISCTLRVRGCCFSAGCTGQASCRGAPSQSSRPGPQPQPLADKPLQTSCALPSWSTGKPYGSYSIIRREIKSPLKLRQF